MTLTMVIVSVLFFLAMQAFFSGSEIAMVSVEKGVLRHQSANGSRGSRYALRMLERPDWMLSTTLVGTNVATVANTTIATAYGLRHLGEQGGVYAVLIMIPLVLLFSEIIPKSIFQQKAHSIVPKIIYGLWLFSILFSPVIYIFSRVSKLVSRNAPDEASPFIQRQELIAMVNTPDLVEGDIDEIEKDMIQRVFNYSETTADLAMTPLSDVYALDINSNVSEAMKLSRICGHIRLPVFDSQPENIIGLINTLEMLGEDSGAPAKRYIQSIHTTSADQSVADLFSDLRQLKAQVSIVTDNQNMAIGLITLEDIMEEVVADIEDEHDKDPSPLSMIQQIGARNYLVNAHIAPDQLSDALNLNMPATGYASLAGLLLSEFDQIPVEGDSRVLNDICFTVAKASPRAILQIRITW
ncbi:MAG: putative hemolysin [Saprospiraceae bacterium]|jgi:putative hemolysin